MCWWIFTQSQKKCVDGILSHCFAAENEAQSFFLTILQLSQCLLVMFFSNEVNSCAIFIFIFYTLHDGCSVICILTHHLHIIWGIICGKIITSLCCCNVKYAVTVRFGFVPPLVVFCWGASALEYKLQTWHKSHYRIEKPIHRGNQHNWGKKAFATSETRRIWFLCPWLYTCCLVNSHVAIETLRENSNYSCQQQSNEWTTVD